MEGVDGPALLDGADCSCHGLIDIPYPEQLGAFRSHIADLQHRALDDGLLDVKVVALYVWRSHVLVHAEKSERRHRRVHVAEDVHTGPERYGSGEIHGESSQTGH